METEGEKVEREGGGENDTENREKKYTEETEERKIGRGLSVNKERRKGRGGVREKRDEFQLTFIIIFLRSISLSLSESRTHPAP